MSAAFRDSAGAGLPIFDFAQVLPLGFRFPARMTVLPLGAGQIALVSPIPIDGEMARVIDGLGAVRFLIAPNLLHHLYLSAARERYPDALVLAPPGLASKRRDLRIDAALDGPLPAELTRMVDVVRLAGAPSIDEFAFYHREARTLVVTDLVFNVRRPSGFLAHLFLWLGGCHGRLASSRVWRTQVKDRSAARASIEQLLALPFETLVMAHGEIVREAARAELERASHWFLSGRRTERQIA